MARMKAVEYLDPEFNKALEKREKKQEREKREKDREKERSRNEPRLFKGSVGGVVTTFHTTVDINHLRRGTYGSRGRGGNTRGSKKPSAENICYTCGGTDHFAKGCPRK